jgi:hypothetical protein
MAGLSSIQYIKRSELDTARWDETIDAAQNSLIYAYSFYLDHMSKHWDALILGDYEYIMPLTWNKKWGIKYLYQPPFTQQLGIFSRQSTTEEIMSAFLNSIENKFSFAEIFLNHDNSKNRNLIPRNNYILSMSDQYEELISRYKKDMKKNLRHAGNFEMNYRSSFGVQEAIAIYQQTYHQRTPHVTATDFQHFGNLCKHLKDDVIVRIATDGENKLLAAALLLSRKNRIYLIQSTTLPAGRENEANYFLLDQVIREFSGNDLILDFEGSDIEGIAHFYMNFGSNNQPYYFYKYNRLAWPWKIFKK